MTKQFELCIVIPCYNEEARLNKKRISDFLNINNDILLYFVNDGSIDNTFEVLNSIKSNFPKNC